MKTTVFFASLGPIIYRMIRTSKNRRLLIVNLLVWVLGCGDTIGQAILPSEDGLTDTTDIPLSWTPNGWISADNNPLRIQGAWGVQWGHDSTITGTYETETTVRVAGTAVPDPAGQDFINYFGAKIGFFLCSDSINQSFDENSASPAGQCPYNNELSEQLMGITFTLEGTLPTTELRLQLSEKGRNDGTYKVIRGIGSHTVWFTETKLHYDPSAPGFDMNAFSGIMFFISSTGGPTDFDFIIKDVSIKAVL